MITTPYTGPGEAERMKLADAAIRRVGFAWMRSPVGSALNAPRVSLDAAEEKLNTTWLDCRAGKADIAAFKRALSAWEMANLTAARGQK